MSDKKSRGCRRMDGENSCSGMSDRAKIGLTLIRGGEGLPLRHSGGIAPHFHARSIWVFEGTRLIRLATLAPGETDARWGCGKHSPIDRLRFPLAPRLRRADAPAERSGGAKLPPFRRALAWCARFSPAKWTTTILSKTKLERSMQVSSTQKIPNSIFAFG